MSIGTDGTDPRLWTVTRARVRDTVDMERSVPSVPRTALPADIGRMPKARAVLAANCGTIALTRHSAAGPTGMATLSPWWDVDRADEVSEAALPRLQ